MWLNHIQFCWCHVTPMSRLSVSSCVTPVYVYGLAASSAVLIPVPGRDCTSTLECAQIAYQAMSIHRTTSMCLLTSDGLTGHNRKLSTYPQFTLAFGRFDASSWRMECRALRFNHRTPVFHVLPVLYCLFKEVSSAAALVQRAALLTSLISRL